MSTDSYMLCTFLHYEPLELSLPLSFNWHQTPSQRNILMKVEKLGLDCYPLIR